MKTYHIISPRARIDLAQQRVVPRLRSCTISKIYRKSKAHKNFLSVLVTLKKRASACANFNSHFEDDVDVSNHTINFNDYDE